MDLSRILAVLSIGCVLASPMSTAGRAEDNPVKCWFQLADERVGPDEVTLTLQLFAFNYSGVPIERAQITLASTQQPGIYLHTIEDLTLAPHGRQQLAVGLTVPTKEYRLWQEGAKPALLLTRSTDDGGSSTMPIELEWHPFDFVAPSGGQETAPETRDSAGTVEVQR